MERKKQSSHLDKYDQRAKLSKVRVLLADRDNRTATLVHRILFSFGFRHIDIAHNGEMALEMLRTRPYDLIITEWNMTPVDGVTLVKAIRAAREDKRIRRDIPIIMLTAQAEKDNVEVARDAGINEFIVKPFTAKTISNRIVMVIDNPRSFVDAPGYVGPCRRRREKLPEGISERRGKRSPLVGLGESDFELVAISAPNLSLREQVGNAAELFTDEIIQIAQQEIAKSETEFVVWAKEDIALLEASYAKLKEKPGNLAAHRALLDAAYSIKAQAGTFGYDLGTGIAGMLVKYLTEHNEIREEKMTVVRKHIDAIVVIFNQRIKDTGREIGQELLNSLRALVKKIG